MDKSLTLNFIGLYRGIFADASAYHPISRKGFDRDLSRLEALSRNMGSKLFTLALPAIGKAFDASLESGRLVLNGLPLTRKINGRTQIPRLFQDFWSRIFHPDGCLKSDIDPNDILFLRTILYAGKKYRADCAPSSVYATVKEYYDVEDALPEPSKKWDSDGSDWDRSSCGDLSDLLLPDRDLFSSAAERGSDERLLLQLAQQTADRVASLLGEYIPNQWRFRHGPGAVSDLQTGRGYKYSFPEWGPRLQSFFPAIEFAQANTRSSVLIDDYESGGIPLVEGASRLYAVPKTQKGPRLIAAEPTANQWCQQSVRDFLNSAIKASVLGRSIDFSRQDLSGEDARLASIDGSRATVDLSSASDRLSCYVVERLFRANRSILGAMISSRTRFLINDIDKKSPKLHKLRKFASMGSALTFPIQTICFYMLCTAAGLHATGTPIKHWSKIGRQVRVYGDDIIVPVSWMPSVRKLLKLTFLKVNDAKTFVNGKFRESCGTDAFQGYIVTPGQVLEFCTPESNPGVLQGIVDTANNLFFKGLWHMADEVLAPVTGWMRKLIPTVPIGSGAFGLISTSGFSSSSPRRWNEDLQQEEYLSLKYVPKKTRTARHESLANLLQYFTEDPSSSPEGFISEWESGLVAKPLTVARKGWVSVRYAALESVSFVTDELLDCMRHGILPYLYFGRLRWMSITPFDLSMMDVHRDISHWYDFVVSSRGLSFAKVSLE